MIPGGFGTGKTMTQHALAKWSDADIIVYIGCGERGNEMTDVLDELPRAHRPAQRPAADGAHDPDRQHLATCRWPRARSRIYTGITIAEYYRDMGYDVGVMADSTSRWAEALRELSGRLEEMPAEEGYPAYLPDAPGGVLRARRLGRDARRRATARSPSSAPSRPPGGDFSEPVTQHTRRFIRCFWALDTDLANARHYPAIHWLKSYSEYVDEVAEWWEKVDPDWRAPARARRIDILQQEDRLQQIVKLVGPDVLPDTQRLILFIAELLKNGFLQQNAFDEVDMYCRARRSRCSMLRDHPERATTAAQEVINARARRCTRSRELPVHAAHPPREARHPQRQAGTARRARAASPGRVRQAGKGICMMADTSKKTRAVEDHGLEYRSIARIDGPLVFVETRSATSATTRSSRSPTPDGDTRVGRVLDVSDRRRRRPGARRAPPASAAPARACASSARPLRLDVSRAHARPRLRRPRPARSTAARRPSAAMRRDINGEPINPYSPRLSRATSSRPASPPSTA